MYRWLGELAGGNVKDTETELKVGGGELSQSDQDPLALGSRRKRSKFSNSFKASVLAAYTSVGPAQAARQFGVSEARSDVETFNFKLTLLQGILMQWRRKAGVTKFTEGGLKKGSRRFSDAEGEEAQTDITKSANTDAKEVKPGGRLGVKKPFYSAELRSRVLSHYR